MSAYLIIGLMFAAFFAAIDHLGGGHFFADGQPASTQTFQYFSFTTLTTFGLRRLHGCGQLGESCGHLGSAHWPDIPGHPAGKKIYYYGCLGSDDYRYQGGRVCASKPVRADYVDAVVWDHVTALLADPALIRGEIDRRLERARTSDPVTKKRGQLQQALAKTTASISSMITAFSEQLLTIDELRARMPDLRARETGLKDQIAALDAQAADRDAYLKLAGDLEGFLEKLRASSATAGPGSSAGRWSPSSPRTSSG